MTFFMISVQTDEVDSSTTGNQCSRFIGRQELERISRRIFLSTFHFDWYFRPSVDWLICFGCNQWPPI